MGVDPADVNSERTRRNLLDVSDERRRQLEDFRDVLENVRSEDMADDELVRYMLAASHRKIRQDVTDGAEDRINLGEY